MYSTCLHCHASLGANTRLEAFPIGQRLAFDGERGRLWVVCGACERWNLTPFDERWDALEDCERLYRDTRRRVSTDNIALARVRGGLDLIRIGRPLRPEFAAWRYGDRLLRRYRKEQVMGGVGTALALGVLMAPTTWIGAAGYGAAALIAGNVGWRVSRTLRDVKRLRTRVEVRASDGERLLVQRADLDGAALRRVSPEGGVQLELRVRPCEYDGRTWQPSAYTRRVRLDESATIALLPQVLAVHNVMGGDRATVRDALALVEGEADVPALLRRSVVQGSDTRPRLAAFDRIAAPLRLALEMAAHEADERRAMAGELGALYARWEEAERVAKIADGVLSPAPR